MSKENRGGSFAGFRLTVQSEQPGDPYFQPKDFFPPLKEGGIYIGRASVNDIVLYHTSVSTVHCRIFLQDEQFWLEDTNSANGTFIGYRRLQPGEKHRLFDGDVINIATYHITFRKGLSAFSSQEDLPAVDVDDELDDTWQLKQNVVQQFLKLSDEEMPPYLEFMNSDQKGEKFYLRDFQDYFIGRDEDNHIRLRDSMVSRRHALLRRDWGGVTIRDLKSENGIFLNRVRIQSNIEVELHDGDQLVIGRYIFKFKDPFASQLSKKLSDAMPSQEDDEDLLLGDTIVVKKKSERRPPPAKPILSEPPKEPVSGRWISPKKKKKNPSTPEKNVEEMPGGQKVVKLPSKDKERTSGDKKSDESEKKEAVESESPPKTETQKLKTPLWLKILIVLLILGVIAGTGILVFVLDF